MRYIFTSTIPHRPRGLPLLGSFEFVLKLPLATATNHTYPHNALFPEYMNHKAEPDFLRGETYEEILSC